MIKEKLQRLLLKKVMKKLLKDYHRDGCFYINEIRPDIYRFLNAGVHMDLIVGREKALLIDTGNGYADIAKAVRKVTQLPLIVVNTHGHLDHTCGNYFFDQEIYIHPDDIELCKKHNSVEMRKYSAGMAATLKAQGNGSIPADFDVDFYISRDAGRLVPAEEGHVFDLGGRTVKVVHLPGHSMGSIGLLCPEEKMLFSGDAVNSSVYLFLEGSAPLSVYRETVKKAMNLDFEYMIVSHGFSLLPKTVLENYLKIAENPDFEHGTAFDSPLIPEGEDVRQCVLEPERKLSPLDEDCASIVISRSNLNK